MKNNFAIQDTFAIRCGKCNTVYGSLGHLIKFGVRICNKCCSTSKYDSKGLFIGCECKRVNHGK